MNLATAKEVLEGIARGEYKIDLCMSNYNMYQCELSVLKFLPKETSSPSVQIFSELVLKTIKGSKDLPVFLKLFPQKSAKAQDQIDLDGLKYEIEVYKKIVDRIILQDISPNFIAYIASACCYDKPSFLSRGQLQTLSLDFRRDHCVLITERAGNGKQFGFDSILRVDSLKNVYDKLLRDNINRVDIGPLLFQIYNALEVMHRFRINHNDLHTGNILVMELPKKISLGFEVDSVLYKIQTKYIPYIFDWDIGYCELLGDNPKISGYQFIDYTNQYTPRRDLYILLCYLNNNEKELGIRSGFINIDLFPIVFDKERRESFPITPVQVKTIRSYIPVYFQENGNPVYKLGKRQAEEIFGKKIGRQNTKNLNTITIEITKDNNGQYYAGLVTGFECRPTSMHSLFPTPLKLLEKMDRFKVDSIKPNSVHKIYKMPKPDVSRRIYIDKTLQRAGRHKLLTQGVKPRFSPTKSGYLGSVLEEKTE